jgi:hypothetical protein
MANTLGDEIYNILHSDETNKEEQLKNIVTSTDNDMRVSIQQYYDANYESKLDDDLKNNTESHFRDIVRDLFLHPFEYDAKQIDKAFKFFSKDDKNIYEILTARPSWYIEEVKNAYFKKYGRDFQKDIEKNFSGEIKKNLVTLLNTPRLENKNPDHNQCQKWAKTLEKTSPINWATDDKIFKEIFATRSPEELVLIGRYYKQDTGKNFLEVVEKELPSKVKQLFREILYNTINPSELFAEKVKNSLEGLGTNTHLLNRVIVSRGDIDMKEIKDMYLYKYKNDLITDVSNDTTGAYRDLLVYLANK